MTGQRTSWDMQVGSESQDKGSHAKKKKKKKKNRQKNISGRENSSVRYKGPIAEQCLVSSWNRQPATKLRALMGKGRKLLGKARGKKRSQFQWDLTRVKRATLLQLWWDVCNLDQIIILTLSGPRVPHLQNGDHKIVLRIKWEKGNKWTKHTGSKTKETFLFAVMLPNIFWSVLFSTLINHLY